VDQSEQETGGAVRGAPGRAFGNGTCARQVTWYTDLQTSPSNLWVAYGVRRKPHAGDVDCEEAEGPMACYEDSKVATFFDRAGEKSRSFDVVSARDLRRPACWSCAR
jgi:hypothetical protein